MFLYQLTVPLPQIILSVLFCRSCSSFYNNHLPDSPDDNTSFSPPVLSFIQLIPVFHVNNRTKCAPASLETSQMSLTCRILGSKARNSNVLITYINKIQRDATVCRSLFTAKLLYVFRVSIAPIIRCTSNCNCSFWYRSYHVSQQQSSTHVHWCRDFRQEKWTIC